MDDLPGSSEDEGSLLPYEAWTEDAFRGVAVRALAHVAVNGLPGDHHFYITFRSDHPNVAMPARLRAQYPDEMTIVLQHKYWDLLVDEAARFMSVGLSFNGIASTLVIPFDAITGFADPSVKWGLRFRPLMPEAAPVRTGPRAVDTDDVPAIAMRPARDEKAPADETEAKPDAEPQVVSLDAFRKRKD
jgi:hypothetical protein